MKYLLVVASLLPLPAMAMESVVTSPVTSPLSVRRSIIPPCTDNQVVGVSGTRFVCKNPLTLASPITLLDAGFVGPRASRNLGKNWEYIILVGDVKNGDRGAKGGFIWKKNAQLWYVEHSKGSPSKVVIPKLPNKFINPVGVEFYVNASGDLILSSENDSDETNVYGIFGYSPLP